LKADISLPSCRGGAVVPMMTNGKGQIFDHSPVLLIDLIVTPIDHDGDGRGRQILLGNADQRIPQCVGPISGTDDRGGFRHGSDDWRDRGLRGGGVGGPEDIEDRGVYTEFTNDEPVEAHVPEAHAEGRREGRSKGTEEQNPHAVEENIQQGT